MGSYISLLQGFFERLKAELLEVCGASCLLLKPKFTGKFMVHALVG